MQYDVQLRHVGVHDNWWPEIKTTKILQLIITECLSQELRYVRLDDDRESLDRRDAPALDDEKEDLCDTGRPWHRAGEDTSRSSRTGPVRFDDPEALAESRHDEPQE